MLIRELTGSKHAVAGAVFYLVAHAMFKGGLFMVAGVVDHEAGVPHDPQVLRHRALCYVEPGSQGVDAQHSTLQQAQGLHPRADGEHLQDSGQPV